MTLIEVTVVVFVLGMLIAMVLSMLIGAKGKVRTIQCVNNQKNVGLALRIFSTDNEGQFPIQRSVTNGGVHELVTNSSQLWRLWLAISNELGTPKILLCPSDRERRFAKPFFGEAEEPTFKGITNNAHLSYFLSVNATEDEPKSILGGDRNITTNGVAAGTSRLVLTTNHVLGFTKDLHRSWGNTLLGDGSMMQGSSEQLNEAWRANIAIALTNSLHGTNVWLVP